MESKIRPFSSQPVKSTPINIHGSQCAKIKTSNVAELYGSRPKLKLSQLIPEMLQLQTKNISDDLLYSKFIAKGIKDQILKSYVKKKQQLTEPSTSYQNKINQQIHLFKSVKTAENAQIQRQQSLHDNNLSQFELNGIERTTSVRGFKKYGNCNKSQQIFVKNKTQANLHHSEVRPINPQIIMRKQKIANYVDENKHYFSKVKRPSTATTCKQRNTIKTTTQSLYQIQQLNELIKLKIKDGPLKIQTTNQVIDYIEKNKQNISIYSKKAPSIYLTNTTVNKYYENSSEKSKICKTKIGAKLKRNTTGNVNLEDYRQHLKPLNQVEHFAIDRLQKVSNQFRQMKQHKIISSNNQQLLSKDLDNHYENHHEQMNERTAKACFEDYIQNCEIIQYDIASVAKPAQQKRSITNTIDVWQCKRIVQIYSKIQSETNQKQKQCQVRQIRQIVKNLKYFVHRSQQQIDKLFSTSFEIIIVECGDVIIESNNPGQYVYIILNGSVAAASQISSTNPQIWPTNAQNIQVQTSLYDGDIFGQICNPSEKLYKSRYTALENSLLMRLKFIDYNGIAVSNNDNEQKLQMLKLAFKSEINSAIITDEELKMISVHLEKRKYPAKTLVFRQGQVFNSLVFIGKGMVQAINEFILSQDKPKQKNVKIAEYQKQKNQQKTPINSKQGTNKTGRVVLSEMRKQNLINYQIVKQNTQKMYYYFMKEQATFGKGHTLNWQPIVQRFSDQVMNKLMVESIHTDCHEDNQLNSKPVDYSLMSNSDETQIYTLSTNGFECLTQELKKKLISKGKINLKHLIKISSEKDMKKWKIYKQKLCENIIQDKKLKRKLTIL